MSSDCAFGFGKSRKRIVTIVAYGASILTLAAQRLKMSKASENPFSIGDRVYIIGKFRPLGKPVLITATISHKQHRQFVAYGEGDPAGAWYFSRKHYNKAVFADKEKALCAFNAFKEDTNK